MLDFLFSRSSRNCEQVDVRRLMGRLINNTTDYSVTFQLQDADSHRAETRCDRRFPLLLFPLKFKIPDGVIVAVTSEVSCQGMGIVTHMKLPKGPWGVVIGPADERLVFRSRVRYSTHIGYGLFASGIQLEGFLGKEEASALLEYVDVMESRALAKSDSGPKD